VTYTGRRDVNARIRLVSIYERVRVLMMSTWRVVIALTQIRNSQGQNGYVFYDDTLTHAAGVADGSVYLARIDPTVYPYSQAVYIDTTMDSHVNPAGWLLNNADCPAAAHVQFWEYGSVTPQGQHAALRRRVPTAAGRCGCSSPAGPCRARQGTPGSASPGARPAPRGRPTCWRRIRG
jgi:hypothetical protein